MLLCSTLSTAHRPILKKDNHEPLTEALALWQQEHGPCEQYQDPDKKEHIQFWDCDDIETLDSYKGKVRVIRAVVSKPDKEPSTTWCFAIVGKRARQLARRTTLQIIRSRWHIEDSGFNQWIKCWNFGHVFRHTPNTLTAVFLLWSLAFNLLQLFVYRRLGRCRRPKDPTDTIRHIVEVMLGDVATLPQAIPWATLLLNTSWRRAGSACKWATRKHRPGNRPQPARVATTHSLQLNPQ